jgi:hypothetical protein
LALTLTLLHAVPAEALPIDLLQIQADLDTNRLLWDQAGIVDYDYQFARSCYCQISYITPGIVSVRDGAITSVVSVLDASPLNASPYLTMNGLFDKLQSAILLNAVVIDVNYDQSYGLPLHIYIDYFSEIIDDETSYTASSFSPVPEPSTALLLAMGMIGLCPLKKSRHRQKGLA